mgnify:CR=1 FL=1
MKKYFFVCAVMALVSGADAAAPTCTVTASGSYMSCKPGYYYDSFLIGDTGKTCNPCPQFDDAISADKNIDGVTSCYLPAGTTGSDSTGTFKYTSDCPYTN